MLALTTLKSCKTHHNARLYRRDEVGVVVIIEFTVGSKMALLSNKTGKQNIRYG